MTIVTFFIIAGRQEHYRGDLCEQRRHGGQGRGELRQEARVAEEILGGCVELVRVRHDDFYNPRTIRFWGML